MFYKLVTHFAISVTPILMYSGSPREIKGPGQRVIVGPQGHGGLYCESQIHPSCKLKTIQKGHYILTMTIVTPSPTISPYLLATLILYEEYCDCSIRVSESDCAIRVYRSFKQVSKGPFMELLGAPFRLDPGVKCPSCPPSPLWVALRVLHGFTSTS